MIGRGCLSLVLVGLLASCGGSSAEPQPAPSPANAPPSFTSAATASVTSGATGTVYAARATDPNNDAITYSIAGGADQALLQIAANGDLSFRAAPDASNPTDQDRNNVYLVQVRASDGQASATLDLALTIVPTASGFRVRRVATGFNQPVFLAPVPGSDRVFVVERAGLIRLLDPVTGTISPTPFLNVANQISTDGERGLLGFVTASNYQASGIFYVFLTNPQGTIEIRRYLRSSGNPDVADGSSGDVILSIPHPNFSNHYGGWIGIASDNLLYIATGDGGGSGDPDDNAQDPNRLLGKILRIDPSADDFPADPNRDYRIPSANPFAGGGGAREVIALGLRNPFRASIDGPSLYIGDVGQNAVEEIDLMGIDGSDALPANFGWPILEGTRAFRGGSTAGLRAPVAEYNHGTGPTNGNTVTGGLVYRGPVTSLQGSYVFADFIRPRLWSIPRTSFSSTTIQAGGFTDRLQSFAPNAGAFSNIVSFGTDRNQNLYIVDFDGEIFVLEASP